MIELPADMQRKQKKGELHRVPQGAKVCSGDAHALMVRRSGIFSYDADHRDKKVDLTGAYAA
jgi:hypothetical protein